VIRCTGGGGGDLSVVAPYLLPFLLNNAKEQLVVSVDSDATAQRIGLGQGDSVRIQVQDEASFRKSLEDPRVWNSIELPGDDYLRDDHNLPLVGHFISVLFPLGHIKSTRPNHESFVDFFKDSPKWLRVC
jgi:hypothetical protein